MHPGPRVDWDAVGDEVTAAEGVVDTQAPLARPLAPALPADPATPEAIEPEPGPPAASRVRARLARLGPTRGPQVAVELEPLFRIVRANHPKADLREVERAYAVAELRHRGQLRRSGEPYITHPLAVAQILADLGMTPPTLAAALLHDTVEDTDYTIDALRKEFGDEVAGLVDGVTKLDKVQVRRRPRRPRRSARWSSRWPVTSASWSSSWPTGCTTCARCASCPPEKQERKARETLEIYAPLAHRLGMNTIKWELEDLAFAILYPKMYDEIVRLVAERVAQARRVPRQRHRHGRRPTSATREDQGRRHRTAQALLLGLPEDDRAGPRLRRHLRPGRHPGPGRHASATATRCSARSTRSWHPVPGRFKDYIAMPKFNMYQSLHTTVIGPEGKPVELQIRTHDMHRMAEYGIAAHWKYKEGTAGDDAQGAGRRQRDGLAAPARRLAAGDRATPASSSTRCASTSCTKQVFVFTPKGDVIELPLGATPVDFAYAVHTEVGHRCVGARVNGKLVPLESQLRQRRRRRGLHVEGAGRRPRAGTG